MVQIWAIRLNERTCQNHFKRLIEHVGAVKKDRINRFLFWQDAQRSLFADLLIRYLVIKAKGINNQEIIFSTNKYGKPRLVNQPDIQFNLSHSGAWVVCGVCSSVEIGIDVERIIPIDLDISKNYFSNKEHQYLKSQPQLQKLSSFYAIWTLKESYIKARGQGLSIPLKSFSVIPINETIIDFNSHINDRKCWNFRQYQIKNNYQLAICAAEKELTTDIHIIPKEAIVEYFLNHPAKILPK